MNHSGKIRVLPPSVSSRIAAGEVIERPAAAVKELVENSLDAGGSFIVIEVEEGGCRLIRVSDNGEGMTKSDALLACQRFATSKVTSEHDLFRIATLGFRGEALPSMASVSKFRLLTAVPENPAGTEVTCTQAGIWEVNEKPAAPGTQVELRDLFYNVPGRKKFLKTPVTEFSHIGRLIQQTALAWPSVHFRLIHNGHLVYDYPATSASTDRYMQIYGASFLEHCRTIDDHRDSLTIRGVIVDPRYARTSRSPQEIFVNRRPVKNTTISHAIYEAYETFLPKGRHPTFIVFLDIRPDEVDVNVHPAKREVRFSKADLVHRTIKAAIRQVLYARQPSPNVFFATSFEDHRQESADFQRSMRPPMNSPAARTTSPLRNNDEPIVSEAEAATISVVEEAMASYPSNDPLVGINPLGQIHFTYLVADMDGELQIVDQHTTHERVLFERLWRSWRQRSIQTQELLIPEPIEVPPHHEALLETKIDDLAHLGLTIERFGPRTFALRAVPALLGPAAYAPLIHGLLEDLEDWPAHETIEKKARTILATMACKSAVQAGRSMTQQEIAHLLADWVEEGRPTTCPHGRRIALHLTKDELDRVFARA